MFYRTDRWDNLHEFCTHLYLHQHAEVLPPLHPAKVEALFQRPSAKHTHYVVFVVGCFLMIGLAFVGFYALKSLQAEQTKKND
jgi:hypothetical protein